MREHGRAVRRARVQPGRRGDVYAVTPRAAKVIRAVDEKTAAGPPRARRAAIMSASFYLRGQTGAQLSTRLSLVHSTCNLLLSVSPALLAICRSLFLGLTPGSLGEAAEASDATPVRVTPSPPSSLSLPIARAVRGCWQAAETSRTSFCAHFAAEVGRVGGRGGKMVRRCEKRFSNHFSMSRFDPSGCSGSFCLTDLGRGYW